MSAEIGAEVRPTDQPAPEAEAPERAATLDDKYSTKKAGEIGKPRGRELGSLDDPAPESKEQTAANAAEIKNAANTVEAGKKTIDAEAAATRKEADAQKTETEERPQREAEPAVAEATGKIAAEEAVEHAEEPHVSLPPDSPKPQPESTERPPVDSREPETESTPDARTTNDPPPSRQPDAQPEPEIHREDSEPEARTAEAVEQDEEQHTSPDEPVKEVVGVVITDKEHAEAMANNGTGTAEADEQSDGVDEQNQEGGKRSRGDRRGWIPGSKERTTSSRYTEEDNEEVRRKIRLSGMLTDPDDEGVQELVAETVNEVMLLANEDGRPVGQIALRDIGVHIDLRPFTLRDAIKEAALALLVKEVPFFEPVDKKPAEADPETEEEKARLLLAEKEKTRAKQAEEAKKKEAAEAKRKDELEAEEAKQEKAEDERVDEEASEAANAPEQGEDTVEVDQEADDTADRTEADNTDTAEQDVDEEAEEEDTQAGADDALERDDEPADDADTDPTGEKEKEEVVDGEFVDEVELWIAKTLEEYKEKHGTDQEGDAVVDGPQPINKEELGYLKHQARLFGVPMKQVKIMSPQALKQYVSGTVEARIEMGGLYRPFSEQIMMRAIYSALSVPGEVDKRMLAEAIFVGTHAASDSLVYREPLHDNHLPSHLKQEGEPRLTAEENYAVLRAHLHSPNPHVRREARLALARRAEWAGVPQHVRRGIPAQEVVRWGRDPSTFVTRMVRQIREDLRGPRQRGVAHDRWAARWTRPVRRAIQRRRLQG